MSTTDTYIKVTILTSGSGQKDLLVGLLSETGFEAFEEEGNTLHAFITNTGFDAGKLEQILSSLNLDYKSTAITPVNWNAEWESNFKPVVVPGFCVIRAAFHKALPGVRHDVIVTPKMSFGTGHHATTYLMLQEMQGLVFDNKDVLDFGTGTGVLAILAEKLGAGAVLAIDNDEWSIRNAQENVEINGCSRVRIERSGRVGDHGSFDVILANINRNVLITQMDGIAQHLRKDGVVIMSGLLSGDSTVISAEAEANGLVKKTEETLEGWIVLQLIHK
jgi:ribosomal protein L11 methyltransferase